LSFVARRSPFFVRRSSSSAMRIWSARIDPSGLRIRFDGAAARNRSGVGATAREPRPAAAQRATPRR